MSGPSPVGIRRDADHPSVVLARTEQYGFRSVDLVHPPRRFWADDEHAPAVVENAVDARRFDAIATPAALLNDLPPDDNWKAQSGRSVARLRSHFLIAEDPQRRLDARPVNTLAHQVSLTSHILENPALNRVLIADEVGLGKTIEAGLLIAEWIKRRPGLRILYLAPARLVNNVRREFDLLGLGFRQWSTSEASDARLDDDPRVIASIHRAVHNNHSARFVATRPWDVIIVDECHHLTDWSAQGGDPGERYKLVRALSDRQPPDGRFVLMSGTPHQGHGPRFENLVKLLLAPGEGDDSRAGAPASLAGRVIYRTKDDVKDWHGRPLFPQRQINEPRLIDLGPAYREWMTGIHDHFRPSPGALRQPKGHRAANWRWAQALQWAASSPQAGLGYLTRQAIRDGWTLGEPALFSALEALRPYRKGKADEPVADLFRRLKAEIDRQSHSDNTDDIEDVDLGEGPDGDRDLLVDLLIDGTHLVGSASDAKWAFLDEQILRPAGTDKVVLFAQPIETVMALAGYLKRTRGTPPALIFGGQDDADRGREVESFWRADGPQFLVSSRAGGEGINLHVAHRLVHIDVPWNPMELEQRVGRVHRFGSNRTIVVDTIGVKDSREARSYQVAKQKLRLIASSLVEPDRFEALFSRVMSLVRVEDWDEVYEDGPLAPLDGAIEAKISAIIQEGFRKWETFHRRFSGEQERIRRLDSGLARWDDLGDYLRDYAKAGPVEGYSARGFAWSGDRIDSFDEPAQALRIDGQVYVCGDHSGSPVVGPGRDRPVQLGLNLPVVVATLRDRGFPRAPTGAAHLRWPVATPRPPGIPPGRFGILAFLRQTVRQDSSSLWDEAAVKLLWYAVAPGADPVTSEGETKRALLDGVCDATTRTRPEAPGDLEAHLLTCESRLLDALGRPTEAEFADRVRHGVTPIFAAVVE